MCKSSKKVKKNTIKCEMDESILIIQHLVSIIKYIKKERLPYHKVASPLVNHLSKI